MKLGGSRTVNYGNSKVNSYSTCNFFFSSPRVHLMGGAKGETSIRVSRVICFVYCGGPICDVDRVDLKWSLVMEYLFMRNCQVGSQKYIVAYVKEC